MIAIPNMEKPKDCEECYISKYIPCNTDYRDCPLIEIVRCEECKHFNEETHGCNRNPSVNAWWETDFCSYGERKEE